MKKKVDERIRTLIENGVKNKHRSVFVVVGDKGRNLVKKTKKTLNSLTGCVFFHTFMSYIIHLSSYSWSWSSSSSSSSSSSVLSPPSWHRFRHHCYCRHHQNCCRHITIIITIFYTLQRQYHHYMYHRMSDVEIAIIYDISTATIITIIIGIRDEIS